MEPITTAIVAALAAGAAAGGTEVGKNALVDAYNGLKGLLTKKFGKKKALPDAVEALEKSPDSQGRQMVLDEEVQNALVHEDPEALQAARTLLAAVQEYAQQSGATGVKLKEIETKLIEIDTVIATGTGVDIENAKVDEGIKISKVKAGYDDPK